MPTMTIMDHSGKDIGTIEFSSAEGPPSQCVAISGSGQFAGLVGIETLADIYSRTIFNYGYYTYRWDDAVDITDPLEKISLTAALRGARARRRARVDSGVELGTSRFDKALQQARTRRRSSQPGEASDDQPSHQCKACGKPGLVSNEYCKTCRKTQGA